MNRLILLACGMASTFCLGIVVARAEVSPTARSQHLPYSQPADDGLLAQATTQGQFSTLCRKQCEQTYAVCNNNKKPDCSTNYNACIQGCK